MADLKPLFIQWCPKDALDGMLTMEPMEELAYRRVLDMIYATDDRLPDDDQKLGWMTKVGPRKWKKIKAKLIEQGKIEITDDGRISNLKCRKTLEKAHKHIGQRSVAGKRSSEKRKSLKNQNSESTGVATTVPTTVPTTAATTVPTVEATNRKPLGESPAPYGDKYSPRARAREGLGEGRGTGFEASWIGEGENRSPARAIAVEFERLREKHHPGASANPIALQNVATEAQRWLDEGLAEVKIIEIVDAGMAARAGHNRSPPRSLKLFASRLQDAAADGRQQADRAMDMIEAERVFERGERGKAKALARLYVRTGEWLGEGPPPGERQSIVDEALLEEARRDVAAEAEGGEGS